MIGNSSIRTIGRTVGQCGNAATHYALNLQTNAKAGGTQIDTGWPSWSLDMGR
jgi:hypothetical protein